MALVCWRTEDSYLTSIEWHSPVLCGTIVNTLLYDKVLRSITWTGQMPMMPALSRPRQANGFKTSCSYTMRLAWKQNNSLRAGDIAQSMGFLPTMREAQGWILSNSINKTTKKNSCSAICWLPSPALGRWEVRGWGNSRSPLDSEFKASLSHSETISKIKL